jgi:hypothetical protein
MHDDVYHSQAIPLPYWLKKEIFEELMSTNRYDFLHNYETLYDFIESRGTRNASPYIDALTNANLLINAFPLLPPPLPIPLPPPPPPHHNGHGGGNKKSKKRKRILRKRKSNKHKVVQRKMQRKKSRHLKR